MYQCLVPICCTCTRAMKMRRRRVVHALPPRRQWTLGLWRLRTVLPILGSVLDFLRSGKGQTHSRFKMLFRSSSPAFHSCPFPLTTQASRTFSFARSGWCRNEGTQLAYQRKIHYALLEYNQRIKRATGEGDISKSSGPTRCATRSRGWTLPCRTCRRMDSFWFSFFRRLASLSCF